MNKQLPSERAFTLIELLVVISLISMLISILLPGLSAARRHAQSVRCGTQLRELARGFAIYAQDNDDVMVAGRPGNVGGDGLYWIGNGWKFRPRWNASLGAAVEIYAYDCPRTDNQHQPIDNPLLICPTVPEWKSEKNSSYGYNFQFLGNSRTQIGGSKFINFPVRMTQRPAPAVFAADSMGTAAHFRAQERTPNRPDGSSELQSLGFHGFMLDPPRMTEDSDQCDNDNYGHRGGPDPRHHGRAQFAWTDGHVAAHRPEEVGYALEPDGSFVFGDERTSNRDFSGLGRDEDPPSRFP